MIAVELARKTAFDQRCVPKWYQNISPVRKKSARFLEEISCEENGYWWYDLVF